MSTHKNIDKICIVVLVLTLLATLAFMNGEKFGIKAITDEDAESYQGSTYFTANDLDGDWTDNAYTTYITLSDNEEEIKGNGAYFLNGDLVISNGGWYVISGTKKDGKIIVDASDSSKIWIRLNGVTVNCSDDSAIRVNQADKVFLTLAEGTENVLTSGSSYSEEALSDNTGGTIFSHDDLTINGRGSLTIKAEYKFGIDVNDSLVITGGNISITAPKDGIHVNDSFRYAKAALTIDAGDDGIHSDDELYIESGTILVPSCCEGLEAVTVNIAGGDITICPSDDGINANGGSSMGFGEMGGQPGPHPGQMNSESIRENKSQITSSKIMKGQNSPTVSSETKNESGDKTQNSNLGEQTDSKLQEKDEGKQKANSSDAEEEETYIRISGGTLTIINETGQDADGLDSNGNIYIDGGEIHISLLGEGSNSAIDYGSENGGECIVTGGTVLAFGGSGMAEEFSSKSTQCAVLYNLEETMPSGTLFRLLDADGEEIISYTPECSYSSVSFSAPELKVNKTYTIVCSEYSAELTLDSTAVSEGSTVNEGMMQNGDKNAAKTGEMGQAPPRKGGQGMMSQDSSGNTEDISSQENEEKTSKDLVSLSEINKNVWILLGASFMILISGILFAVKYRK